MITQENPKRLKAQACPLCREQQDVIVNGQYPDPDNPAQHKVDPDRGYSFCNCRNIFFTDWSNMQQDVYAPDYSKKYYTPNANILFDKYPEAYGKTISDLVGVQEGGKIKSFLEIGSIAPFVMDGFKKRGFRTIGLDIFDHKCGDHPMIVGDFEKDDIWDKNSDGLLSVVWASHVFEHFKDPIRSVKKAYNMLEDGGVLFVAMPDPYMIDWKAPYTWGHWHIREHHILWDMDSFCTVLEETGFEIQLKHRNAGYQFICIGDYHIIAQKKA